MAIGMPVEDYWEKPQRYCNYYLEAHMMKNQQRNEEMWVQGMYFYDAVRVALQNGFGKKGAKRAKYAEKPFEIYPKLKTQEEIAVERERQKITDNLVRMQRSLAEKYGSNSNKS